MKILLAAIALSLTLFGCGGGGEDVDTAPSASMGAAKPKSIAAYTLSKELTAFSIGGVNGSIDGTNISVILPIGANRNNRIASFTSTGITVSVNGVVQSSGVTANNFTTPVIYKVAASDGTFTNYTVAVAVTSFVNDWEGSGALIGAGKFAYLEAVAPYSFQRVFDQVRQGSSAARVEVRPGDTPVNSGTGERAEVSWMRDANWAYINETEASGTQYISFSFKLDSAWQSPARVIDGQWASILQLHGPSNVIGSPPIMVSVQDQLSVYLGGGDRDFPAKSIDKYFPLANSSLGLGHWVDLIIKIKFAKDFTGAVTVWRRDEGQTVYSQVLDLQNVPTLVYKSSLGSTVSPHYWKHGLYRSKQTTITNVLWLDGLTRYSYQ